MPGPDGAPHADMTAQPRIARKTVTLLFCDVVGSTALGERFDPEVLRGVMGRYFALAQAAVERHGGTVEKFVGDAVLAVFGIPEVHEDDALRAVRAAGELSDELAALGDELESSMGLRLTVRIAVNSGPVVSGAPRAGGSFATGDPVNTAARLEQHAPPGEVLLGAATWSLVRDAVVAEPLEPIAAKGKGNPVPAYRLVRVLDVARGRTPPEAATLIGREPELETLAGALDRSIRERRCELVTVLGPAGIGKSTLIEHFARAAADRALVVTGRCLSYGTGVTFLPIVQALRQGLGVAADAAEPQITTALEELLDNHPHRADVVDRLLPAFGFGEGGVLADTFWAVRQVLARFADHEPVILAIDDGQWADSLLIDMLDDVRAGLEDVPLLLLVQARPEFREQRPAWGAYAAALITLEPLPEPDVARLIADALGGPLPDAVGRAVTRWAGGVPLFVHELVAHLVEEGVLARTEDGWQVTGDLDQVSVPASLTVLLTARLDKLPSDERELLELAAVAGLEFTNGDLVAAGAPAGHEALLAALRRRELIRRTGGPDGWAFRHVLLREAAYDAMSKAARAAAHERIAERFETSGHGAETGALAAHHLQQAVRFRRELATPAAELQPLVDRTVGALCAAMETAWDTDNLPAAVSFGEQSTALLGPTDPRRRELLVQRALLHQGDHDAAAVESIIAQLGDPGEARDDTVSVLSMWARIQGAEEIDIGRALTVAERAATAARAAGDPDRLVAALKVRLSCYMNLASWLEVSATGAEIAAVGRFRDRRGTLFDRAAALVWGPTPVPDALRGVREFRADPALSRDTILGLDQILVALLAWDDQLDAAQQLADETEPLLAQVGGIVLATSGFLRVWLPLARDDTAAAVELVARTVGEFDRIGVLGGASTMLGQQALLLLELGDREQAERVLAQAEAATVSADVSSVAQNAAARAILAALDGDADTMAAFAAAARRGSGGGDNLADRAEIRRWLSRAHAVLGDAAGESRLLREARELYVQKGVRSAVRQIDAVLSRK